MSELSHNLFCLLLLAQIVKMSVKSLKSSTAEKIGHPKLIIHLFMTHHFLAVATVAS